MTRPRALSQIKRLRAAYFSMPDKKTRILFQPWMLRECRLIYRAAHLRLV